MFNKEEETTFKWNTTPSEEGNIDQQAVNAEADDALHDEDCDYDDYDVEVIYQK